MTVLRTIAAAIATAAIAATPAFAQPVPQMPNVATLVENLTTRMDAISAYKAHVRVDIHLHTFPFLAARLNGTSSYARPGRYTVTFNSLPNLARAFQNVSGDIGDPAEWPGKYVVSIDPSTVNAAPNTLVLRLTQKTRGQIDHVLAYVDLPSETVSRMEWNYYSGGRIAMEQHFAPVDGVLVVDHQAADIDMPGYKATADAVFDNYNIQVGMMTPTHRSGR